MGVEETCRQIHERKHAEAAKQGKEWCERWGHLFHSAGQPCRACEWVEQCAIRFWALWEMHPNV